MTALNVQLARDEVAHILGGTLVRAGVYSGVGAVSAGGKSIKFAFGRVIDPASLGEDGVCAVVMYGGTEVLGGAGDLTAYTHTLRIHLVLSALRSMIHEADAILTPFIPAIRSALAASVTTAKLNGAVDSSELASVSDIGDSPIYPDRLAIDFTLRATQKEAVSFGL